MKVAEIVTNKIIEELEKGVIPWMKPWTGQGKCINYVSRKSYSFMNEMLLLKPGEYMTFKQCKDKGGSIKKGAKSQFITFWKMLPVKEKDKNGKEIEKVIPMLRYYNVFHIDDCEGIETKNTEAPNKVFNDIETAEKVTHDYFKRNNIKFKHIAGDSAHYSPSFDEVVLPLKKQFVNEALYYETLFHEAVHSTGHSTRLARIKTLAAVAKGESYAKEELVAEIGAAILLNVYGIENDKTIKNNAAYIQGWLTKLRNDNNFIISASSQAQKAVALIQNIEN